MGVCCPAGSQSSVSSCPLPRDLLGALFGVSPNQKDIISSTHLAEPHSTDPTEKTADGKIVRLWRQSHGPQARCAMNLFCCVRFLPGNSTTLILERRSLISQEHG